MCIFCTNSSLTKRFHYKKEQCTYKFRGLFTRGLPHKVISLQSLLSSTTSATAVVAPCSPSVTPEACTRASSSTAVAMPRSPSATSGACTQASSSTTVAVPRSPSATSSLDPRRRHHLRRLRRSVRGLRHRRQPQPRQRRHRHGIWGLRHHPQP